MKISGVETIRVAIPPRRPHRVTFDRTGIMGRYVIVRLLTDQGVSGLGEATVLPMWGGDHMRYFGESPGTTVHMVTDYLVPAILGQDPFDIEAIHAMMDRTVKGYPYAKAAIDGFLDGGHLGDFLDVDDQSRPYQTRAHLHKKIGAAGQDACGAAGRSKGADRFVKRARRDVSYIRHIVPASPFLPPASPAVCLFDPRLSLYSLHGRARSEQSPRAH